MQSKLDAQGDRSQKKNTGASERSLSGDRPKGDNEPRLTEICYGRFHYSSQMMETHTAPGCLGLKRQLAASGIIYSHDEEFMSKLANNNFRYACFGRTIYDVKGSQTSFPDCSGFEIVMTAPLRHEEKPHVAGFLPPHSSKDDTQLGKKPKKTVGESSALPADRERAVAPKNASPSVERDWQQPEIQGILSRFLRSATKLSLKMYANGQRMMNTIGGVFGGFK